MFTFFPLPWIAIVVNAHSANDTAHMSVGENFYPFPWLSVGASDWILVPLCKCSASQRRFPTYLILEVKSVYKMSFTLGLRKPESY